MAFPGITIVQTECVSTHISHIAGRAFYIAKNVLFNISVGGEPVTPPPFKYGLGSYRRGDNWLLLAAECRHVGCSTSRRVVKPTRRAAALPDRARSLLSTNYLAALYCCVQMAAATLSGKS